MAVKFPRVFDNTDQTLMVNGEVLYLDKDKRSDASASMLEYWDKSDAIVAGAGAVKEQGKKYLPKFPDEADEDFNFRLGLTKFTNIYRDIVEVLASKPFEESIAFVEEEKVSQEIEDFSENVDGRGNNLTVFAGEVFFSGINSAVHWILIDYPKANPNVRSKADQKKANIRPYWQNVLGRNVLKVKSEVLGGIETITEFKILEPGSPDNIREFKREGDIVTWELFEKSSASTVTQSLWRLIDNGDISIGVIPAVPFATGRRDGNQYKYFPPMRDAIDLQIDLYQQESALKFTKTMVAYPMLSGNGVKPEKDDNGKPKKLRIGPNSVLYVPPDASGNVGSWSYVEPSSSSLTFLASEISETKKDLRELGRQPLTAQSGNLTVITTAVAAGKAKSVVNAWGILLKDTLENAYEITKLWLKDKTSEVNLKIYDDYDIFESEESHLNALSTMRSSGDLSQKTLWENMKNRGVLSEDFDSEKEVQFLLEENPNKDFEDFGDDDNSDDDPDLIRD